MTARTSTQAHAHTRPRGQISRAEKKEKRLGFWFSKHNFRLEKSKYIYYKDLFKLLSQTVTKQEK